MRRALYISHTGMTEPLGQSQVVPYVSGLTRAGWQMEVIAFEPDVAWPSAVARTTEQLRGLGIGYHPARRSPSHALGVKFKEAGEMLVRLLTRTLYRRPDVIHARSYLPAAAAASVAALFPEVRFLFDVRGFVGEEHLDVGDWTPDSLEYRLVKAAERDLMRRAAGVVVLTEKHRRWLRDQPDLVPARTPIEVIPCCVDLERFRRDEVQRAAVRQSMNAGDRLVVVYSGTLGSWYRAEDMARLFASIRRRRPALFAVYTQSDARPMRRHLEDLGVPAADVHVRSVSPADMPGVLSAGDAAVSFVTPSFSKLASSPTKVAEYLSMGMPVVMNRGVGDSDALIDREAAVVDAGELGPEDIDRAAARLLEMINPQTALAARRAAEQGFALQAVGIHGYCRIYDRMVTGG
jgi:glycosyltransferase involved in cell wall biosynthesis